MRLSGRGQSLKLSTKAAAFKRVSLLIEGAKHVDWGARPAFGAGPGLNFAAKQASRELRTVTETHMKVSGRK